MKSKYDKGLIAVLVWLGLLVAICITWLIIYYIYIFPIHWLFTNYDWFVSVEHLTIIAVVIAVPITGIIGIIRHRNWGRILNIIYLIIMTLFCLDNIYNSISVGSNYLSATIPTFSYNLYTLHPNYYDILSAVISALMLIGTILCILYLFRLRVDRSTGITIKPLPRWILINALSLACLDVLVTLGALGYYGFIVPFGISWKALQWGLPVILIIIGGVTGIFLMYVKKKWGWGIATTSIALTGMVYFGLVINVFSSAYISNPSEPAITGTQSTENSILSQILITQNPKYPDYYSDFRPLIINPEVTLSNSENFSQQESWLKQQFANKGYQIDALVDKLYELNPPSTQLNIPSSPDDVYFVDYEGKFNRYSSEGRDGWRAMHLFYPNSSIYYISASNPSYDPDSNFALVYFRYKTYLEDYAYVALYSGKDHSWRYITQIGFPGNRRLLIL
uniref:Uncharacterized protein n=1 Tax=uncultured Dehalococcoidia bacterium TaxID=498747 RepID=A0A871Y7G3_9CHLR|nr:hypothetical protein HULAa30F3_00005 [uncultured Dehalococcoidia bacterium]